MHTRQENTVPQSENINELAAALAKAQGSMKAAAFNKTNTHFKNKYADLTAIIDAVRKPLNENGLAFTQSPEMHDGIFCLVTRLLHSSGQWTSGEYPLPANGTPQQFGSALTYAKRYSLAAMVGISADDDDDAEAARKDGQVIKFGRVTPEQADELQRLVVSSGADLDKFLKWSGADSVSDIAAGKFLAAVEMLEAKRAKK
jgi:hypothetical protein